MLIFDRLLSDGSTSDMLRLLACLLWLLEELCSFGGESNALASLYLASLSLSESRSLYAIKRFALLRFIQSSSVSFSFAIAFSTRSSIIILAILVSLRLYSKAADLCRCFLLG